MPVLRESRIVIGERERGRERVSPIHNGIPRSSREHTWLRRNVKGYIAACTARGDAGRGLLTRTDWRTHIRGIYRAVRKPY